MRKSETERKTERERGGPDFCVGKSSALGSRLRSEVICVRKSSVFGSHLCSEVTISRLSRLLGLFGEVFRQIAVASISRRCFFGPVKYATM